MKAISGVLLGYALVVAFVGTAFARGPEASASGSASSYTRSEGTVEGQAESSTNMEAGGNAGASLDAIRDRARNASAKALARVERKLTEISKQIDAEADKKGDIAVAGRVASEFGMTGEAMTSEQARLDAGMGELVIAHTLAANSKKAVTTRQIFTLQREGFTWGQIAHGLNLRLDEVTAAVTSEGHVAAGRAKADGKPAMIRSATRVSSNTNAGVRAGRASAGTSSSAGVGLDLGK